MTDSLKPFLGRRLLSAGNAALVAGFTTTLLATRVCLAQPGLEISAPPDGASFTAGSDIPLMAVVTHNGTAVTRVDFLANGTPIGVGQPDPHGEWEYTDGSHLSIMLGFFGESMDYSTPGMAEFFMMGASYITPTVFVGEFTTRVSGNPVTGPVTVTLSFNATGQLSAAMNGAPPLGRRTLTAGTRFGDEVPYHLHLAASRRREQHAARRGPLWHASDRDLRASGHHGDRRQTSRVGSGEEPHGDPHARHAVERCGAATRPHLQRADYGLARLHPRPQQPPDEPHLGHLLV